MHIERRNRLAKKLQNMGEAAYLMFRESYFYGISISILVLEWIIHNFWSMWLWIFKTKLQGIIHVTSYFRRYWDVVRTTDIHTTYRWQWCLAEKSFLTSSLLLRVKDSVYFSWSTSKVCVYYKQNRYDKIKPLYSLCKLWELQDRWWTVTQTPG